MKYKVGDKIKIKSLKWYNENKDEYGDVDSGEKEFEFVKSMVEHCGKVATIISRCESFYRLNIDKGFYRWSDNMFEETETFKNNTDATSKIDWEQRRYELAKVVMSSLLCSSSWQNVREDGFFPPKLIEDSLEYADKMIDKLKNNK